MKKKLFSLLLAIVFTVTTSIISLADNAVSLSLEAPQKVNIYYDQDIMLRWTIPQSIVSALKNEEFDGDLFYCIDWKLNDGPWHFDVPKVNNSTYDRDKDTDVNFFGYVGGLIYDENDVQEVFFTHWSFGYDNDEDIDLANKKYTFRMRFAFKDYYLEEGDDFITSPYSNEVSIGGGTQAQPPKTIDAPQNLKVELKKYESNGRPYFDLSWTNPDSVSKINEAFPIGVKVDFKVGNGQWYSEKEGHDWWGKIPYGTSDSFDPIENQYVDSIKIEENDYYFRVLYAYEPVESPRVVSGFSNIVKLGTPAYESASDWAVDELDQAAGLGFITDSIKGNMSGPITREEFAEVAVNFYEIVTGKKADVHPTETFSDCSNPEVLKAQNLGIVYGVGNGKFLPKDLLQRQQMAAMITRTLTACFENVTKEYISQDVKGVIDFKDQADFADYGLEPAKFMAKYKITVGDGKGNFGPVDNCTREQSVMFLLRSYLYQDLYMPQ